MERAVITVEKRNPKGVFAAELQKWLNYSKFYKGGELQQGRRYAVELDGDFIMSAEELPQSRPATQATATAVELPQSLANSPEYLALKLAVEFAKEKQEFKNGEQVIELAEQFKAFLRNEINLDEIPF